MDHGHRARVALMLVGSGDKPVDMQGGSPAPWESYVYSLGFVTHGEKYYSRLLKRPVV